MDRTDPIPARVGAPGGVDFSVNPAVPVGMDGARFLDVVGRSLSRWGDRQVGTTGLAPVRDGSNVVGISNLPAGVLGRVMQSSLSRTVAVPSTHVCVPSGATVADKSVKRQRTMSRATVRRDLVRRGRVRRRSVKVSLARYRDVLRTTSVAVSRCRAQSGVQRSTTTIETDVQFAPSPGGGAWQMGPAKPTVRQWDFETTVLHELGHVSGLKHQLDPCDPTGPMPAGEGNGDWWHAADDWSISGCDQNLVSPPTQGADSSEPITPGLAGTTLYVNPAVPRGVDPGRWLALAQRVIARAGAQYGGTTTAPPQPGDDTSVIGFATLDVQTYSWPIRTPVAVTSETPTHETCAPARRTVRERFVIRRTIRVKGRRVRRDVLKTRSVKIRTYRCTTATASVTAQAGSSEADFLINGATFAWQAGPDHPDDGTRMDLETALIQGVEQLAGAPQGAPCDATTANTSLASGDWWRSSADVRRSNCQAAASPAQSEAGGRNQVLPEDGVRVSGGAQPRTTVVREEHVGGDG